MLQNTHTTRHSTYTILVQLQNRKHCCSICVSWVKSDIIGGAIDHMLMYYK